MSSLASIAHHHVAGAPFNADYYVATATIIPVLFLAIAVQGQSTDNLVTAAYNSVMHAQQQARERALTLRASLGGSSAESLTQIVAAIIVLIGVVGEITAVCSLYLRRPFGGATAPLFASVVHTIVLAKPPLIAAISSAIRAGIAETEVPAARTTSGGHHPSPALRHATLTRTSHKPGGRARTGTIRKGR